MASTHQPFSMVSKMTEPKENTKKTYRYTKQLIRLAIENGYTNQEIAVKAGLSPKSVAVVSRWRNGKALATERQMQFLINEFEHLLKRKMEHLFYGETETPNKFTYYKVQGEILLTHTLHYIQQGSKYYDHKQQKVGIFKFVIINENEKFHVIYLERAGMNHHLPPFTTSKHPDVNIVSNNNEQANWYLKSSYKNLTPQELVHTVEGVLDQIMLIDAGYDQQEKLVRLNQKIMTIMKQDGFPFKFILRQSLLKHGYCSDDIVELSNKTMIIDEPKKA